MNSILTNYIFLSTLYIMLTKAKLSLSHLSYLIVSLYDMKYLHSMDKIKKNILKENVLDSICYYSLYFLFIMWVLVQHENSKIFKVPINLKLKN